MDALIWPMRNRNDLCGCMSRMITHTRLFLPPSTVPVVSVSSHDFLPVTPQSTDNPTVESTTGQTDDDSAMSDSELEPGHVATVKPRHRTQDGGVAGVDFFFGDQVRVDGEGDVDDIYEDELSGLNMDSWTLPNEAFSQRHEIIDTYR